MKTFASITTTLLLIWAPIVLPAQMTNTGSYSGSIKSGDLNFQICNKTITGSFKSEWSLGTPKTIEVSLKGEGIEVQTTTTSSENTSGYYTERTDVFSGTVNGQPVSGSFTKTYFSGFKGTVKIGGKTITADKTYLNYELNYDGVKIACKRKVGTKQKFNMVWGDKKIDGTINSKVNLGKNTMTSAYAFTSPQLTDDEIAVWLFLFVSSEIFSGR